MEKIDILSEQDIVLARTAARELAGSKGFSIMSKTRIATAVSELARNVYLHGGGGRMEYEVVNKNGRYGIRCEFIDEGPGISDIENAMEEGFSTSSTLGHGLPGARRLVDEFEITSTGDNGTRVEIIKWE
jgi:serine/threonine-protein kinase RsbT